MKSDRRMLTVAAVFVCFLIFSAPLRSFFLFGARLFASHITLQDQNGFGANTLTFWSLTPFPSQSGPSRDEKLALAIIQTNNNWNALQSDHKDSSVILEKYCQDNPDDLAAKAHTVRLMLNLQSLKKLRTDDSIRLKAQAERMFKIASDGAAKEPDNWFWRERQFHYLILMEETQRATDTFIAKPFPTKFDDHIVDEVVCKEALYNGQYLDLPKSAIYPIWAGIIMPNLSTGGQLREHIKYSKDSLQLRIAEIEEGRAMVKSCPNAIAAMVGINHIRLGLWNHQPRAADSWKDYYDEAEQQKIQSAYQHAVSPKEWDYCLRVAKSDVIPNFLQPDRNLFGIFIGQFGPFFIYAGISCILIGIGYLLLNRTKLTALGPHHLVWPMLLAVVTYSDLSFYADLMTLAVAVGFLFLIRDKFKKLTFESMGWPSLLFVLSFVGSGWKDWGFFESISLGNPHLFFLLLPLSIWAMVVAAKREDGKRLISILTILLALILGSCYRGWEASSLIFVILFLMQRGKPQLRPWPVAITLLLAGYHSAISLGLHTGKNETHLGFICLIVILYLMSKHELEPDQPRFSLATVGLGAIVFGTILVAQYDNGYKSAMETDLKQNDQIRALYANL